LIPKMLGKLDHHMVELVQGASAAFAMKLLAAAAQFLLSVYVARVLGAEKTGIFFLVLTILLVGSIIGRAGLDNALLRFTAAASSLGRWDEVRGVYGKGMGIALTVSAVTAALLYAGASSLSLHLFHKPDLAGPLRIASLALVPMVLALLHAELLKALKRIVAAVFVQGIGIQALTLAIFWVFARRWEVEGAVWAYVAAAWATFLGGLWLWRRATPRLSSYRGSFPTRELLASSVPLFFVASMTFVMGWAGTLFLGIWGSSADVGIFTAAVRTALLISLVLVAVNAIAAPKFAELYRQGDMAALSSVARTATVLVSVLAAPLFIFFVAFSTPVMSLFGQEFVRGGTVLAILATGQYVNVLTGSVGYLLMMTGNERLVRDNMAVAATLNLVLNVVLIRAYGLIGAAIATAVAIAVLNLGAMYLAYRKLGIMTAPIRARKA
jgi:O-antigen/teichoic acid export membrane protein